MLPSNPEPEAPPDAISAGFEGLGKEIAELSVQLRRVVVGQSIEMGLLLLVALVVLTPYISALAEFGK